jgi:predicted ATPase/class 3 adenylate cyclase
LSDTFCASCGQSLAVATARETPQAALTHVPERRPVTVLCCALHTVGLDLDTRHAVLLEAYAQTHDLVHAYGGQLHPIVGERFLLVFGVPTAQEDDARRALHVAWALRQRLDMLYTRLGLGADVPLAWHMGLHTGLTVVGALQAVAEDAATLTLVGDVAALAIALQEQAAPSQILCSAATARLIESAAALLPAPSFQVAAHAGAVTPYTVDHLRLQPIPMATRLQRLLSPFVGREREMALLHAVLSQVEAGRGQVVGIVGEAGLGKSRLLYEFRQHLDPARYTYVTGQCLSYATTTPYGAVLDLLRHTCGLLETDSAAVIRAHVEGHLVERGLAPEMWAPLLLHLLGVSEETSAVAMLQPETRKLRTLTALTEFWLHGTHPRPLILEVENLHWLDASSEECLQVLIERLAGVPLLLLGTYRPGYRPPWMVHSYVTQIPLQPLTPADSLQVVQATLPDTHPPTSLLQQLVGRAGGNPFFLEELALTVAEQGAGATASSVPDTVQAVLHARMDRLPRPVKRLLYAAAVLGKDGMVPLLQAVTEVSEEALTQGFHHLQGAELLYETYTPPARRYTFKHALTHEVAYQSLVRQARRQWHSRIVQVLEAQFGELVETQPEVLAHHCTEAGLTAQALVYWQRAGARAVERSANIEAVSHFRRALQLVATLPPTPERVSQELTFQLALASPLLIVQGHTSPDVQQAYTRAYTLSQQLDDAAQRFAVLAGLWRFYLSDAQLGTAAELATQCWEVAQALSDVNPQQEAYLMVGSTAFFQGEFPTARTQLEQAAAVHDAQAGRRLARSRGTAPGVVSRARLAWTLWRLGYPDQARRRSQEAIALAEEVAHAYSLTFARLYDAHLYGWCGLAAETRTRMNALLPVMREQGFVQFLGCGLMRYGWALAAQGEVAAGITHLQEGLTIQDTYGVMLGHQEIFAVLAWAYQQAGQLAEGFAAIDQALELAFAHNEQYCLSELHRLYGELCRQDGRLSEAETAFQQARTVARQQQAKAFELRSALSLSRLWHAQGQHAAARQCLAEVYGWFTEGFDTQDLREAHALLQTLS